ncbi:hypothetical protein COT49_01340 [candidate division WWE3 bacterium CG08_land_8_20_14_0_20_40_13]|uniref:UPF0102 protein COT49_01340 n=1 Tax=candidate division WWE3 bacterium CG08_land_8_20_14_0_20_40_13 TaxID=1975084 RepID=A0A2H0XE23_UNCKA|nr:MAG: hypothetical protein COT49_01340 [candidate division WWE3 bacterium CG08_land_8_20_14_0_20_40_13]
MAYKENKEIGSKGEDIACDYLKSQGYKIIETNYRAKNFGEIDIVAIKGRKTVFVEVKTRTSDKMGRGDESINQRKLSALRRVCWIYIGHHPELPQSLRLDAILIMLSLDNRADYTVRHFENLDVSGSYRFAPTKKFLKKS